MGVGFLPPIATMPSLVMLVNGARFDLGEDVAKRLLRPPQETAKDGSGRAASRAAIAQSFRGHPALESLPACDHDAYWPKVDALRARLLATPPTQLLGCTQLASGNDVIHRIEQVIAALNGEAEAPAPQAALLEPESATEVLYRCQRLDPLVEEIARWFAAARATGDLSSSTADDQAVQEALEEFDRRATRLLAAHAGDAGSKALVPEGLLADVRARLSARLVGVNETLARGRQQQAAAQRRLLEASPDNQQKCLSMLEKLIQEAATNLQQTTAWAKLQITDLQAALNEHRNRVASHTKRHNDAEAELSSDMKRVQDRWHMRLRDVTAERNSGARTQQSKSNNALSQLQAEVRNLTDLFLDPQSCAAQLSDVRQAIETGRAQRHEAGAKAGQALDNVIQQFRSGIDKEAGALLELRESTTQRLQEGMREVSVHLEEERCERRDRLNALAEVVDRLRDSLEASAESAHAPWIGVPEFKPHVVRKPYFSKGEHKRNSHDDECTALAGQIS